MPVLQQRRYLLWLQRLEEPMLLVPPGPTTCVDSQVPGCCWHECPYTSGCAPRAASSPSTWVKNQRGHRVTRAMASNQIEKQLETC